MTISGRVLGKISMRSVFAAVAMTVAAVGAVEAKDIIRCTSAALPDITITLNEKRMFKRQLSCINGPFIADMMPCAPEGAFGLSAPTGSAALVKIVDRWQDYSDHLGGVASHFATKTVVHFAGGCASLSEGYKEGWSFDVDRLSGVGTLKLTGQAEIGMMGGKTDAKYQCAKAKPRF